MTQADADRAAAKFPGTNLADLEKGKTTYEANCGKCHKLHAPASRNEEAWRKIVPPMAKKSKLDAASEDLVLRYVVTMSTK
jgi:cytochrome c5